jgi:hypothetical protein
LIVAKLEVLSRGREELSGQVNRSDSGCEGRWFQRNLQPHCAASTSNFSKRRMGTGIDGSFDLLGLKKIDISGHPTDPKFLLPTLKFYHSLTVFKKKCIDSQLSCALNCERVYFDQYLWSKKKTGKKIFRPTDPNFLAYVTGNIDLF